MRECEECGGKGKYYIFNAYDPKYKEEVVCEYCRGREVPAKSVK